MRTLKLGAALILVAALVLFLLQNLGEVEVSFAVWETSLPLAVPILGAFFIGGLAARPLLRFLNRRRQERAADRRSARIAAEATAE